MRLRGLYEHRLKIRLKTPPVDEEPNKYLIKYLSKAFKLPKKTISNSKGLTSRLKIVSINPSDEIPSQLDKFKYS